MSDIQALIEHHLAELHRDGVTVVRAGLPATLVEQTRLEFQAFARLNDDRFGRHRDADGHFPRIINLHLAFERLMDLFALNPVALGVQDGFFGRPSSIYTSLYYERGSAQPMHRDTPYFCTRPELQYLGVWVALERANAVNGCLEVLRGGHLLPEVDREAMATRLYGSPAAVPPSSDLLWNEYQETVTRQCLDSGLRPELVEVEAGDTVIWHPQLPHGGSRIQDISRSRHSLVMHVTPVGTPVYYHDVFFNPTKDVPDLAPWNYGSWRDRQYALHPTIEFGHQDPTAPTAFRRLEDTGAV